MSNRNQKGNTGVNPIAVAAGVGLGALAAVGGYLFGRYQESQEKEAEEAAAAASASRRPPPRRTASQNQAQAAAQPSAAVPASASRQQSEDFNDDEIAKPNRDRECIICFREFVDVMKNNEEIHTTPCGHVFCYACIRRALREKGRCPVCREVTDPEHTLRIFL